MHATLPRLARTDFPNIKRDQLETLQVNLGYLCNQSCLHCHVNAGPKRKEIMQKETIEDIIRFLDKSNIKRLDLTGGAPELNPYFRYLVSAAVEMGIHVIDRCNLTVLHEPGQEDTADFLAQHQVEIVASLPCYLEENVDGQRGDGVFHTSVEAIHLLNKTGYGIEGSELKLNLMYNPTGAHLPPAQCQLEQDYKRELKQRYGIVFNHLFTLTNMPIKRFGSSLISKGEFDNYMALLKSAYKTTNLETVMCRSLISVDWKGHVYDCDFNQMLELPLTEKGKKMHLNDVTNENLQQREIMIADHCYGCTAGQGSSCGGALA
ncbi:MAG: arsenosugar biosynthesis radical SAM protein ArsS [Gammaproteobacteria bacterium]|nr:arsenosugar biosynthesis radical SAM protein ArsS [Gammaproteobacteria bacterium]